MIQPSITSQRIRAILADDQAWLRSALRLLLERQLDIEIVAEVGDLDHLLQSVQREQPDLVLLDWELPGVQHFDHRRELLARLRGRNRLLQVIALSGRPESGRSALAAGADAFVSKADPPEQLVAALRKAQDSINMRT